MTEDTRRAMDPQIGLWMVSGVVWVRCPSCDRAAPVTSSRRGEARLACSHCGHVRDGRHRAAALAPQVQLASWNPRCSRSGVPLPRLARPTAHYHKGQLFARARCRGCGHSDRYPAIAVPAAVEAGAAVDPNLALPLYLVENIGGEVLWVYNLAHLDLLDRFLGASLRERVARPGQMTMMARLPRWMKIASARPKLRRALADLRALAAAEGIS